MRRGGRRQGLGEQQVRSGAGKSEAAAGSGELQQGVIAGIGARGDTEVEIPGDEFAAQAMEFPPGPAMEAIFALEGGPRRRESDELDLRREAGEQRRRVRLGEQRDVRPLRRAAQEGHGQRQIAEAPKLGDEQAGADGVVRRFCQARGVKF